MICPDDTTADRYAGPIPTSLEDYTHWPTVLRPARVPVLDSEAALTAATVDDLFK